MASISVEESVVAIHVGKYIYNKRIARIEHRFPPGQRPHKVQGGLKMGNSDVCMSKFNQLLIKHMYTMCENFKKIRQ